MRAPTRRRALARGLAAAVLVGCRHVPVKPLSPTDEAARFEARSLDAEGLRAFLESLLGEKAPAWPLARWDDRALTAAALYYRPSVDLARAQAHLAAAGVETAGERPNPTLGLAPELASNPASGVSPWLAAVHLDWPIETAGKRGHRIDRADALAEASRHALSAQAWDVRREVVGALVALAAARHRAASLGEESAIEERLLAALGTRVRLGAASAGELAPIRLAALQASSDLAVARTQAAAGLPALASAIGVPAARLGALAIADPPPADTDPRIESTRDELLRGALLQRSDVLAALARYAAAEAALRLELAKQFPDLHLGTGYQFDQGENKWSLGLSVDLPLMNRNEGPIAEAEAAREEASAAFDATQAAVVAEVEQALARRDGLLAERARLRAVREDRERNLARVRAALALGATDRASELAAEIEALRARRAAEDTDTALRLALADLERAVEPALFAEPRLDAPLLRTAREDNP